MLVTGADGFVGRVLCPLLASAGHRVRGAVRTLPPNRQVSAGCIAVGDIGAHPDWRAALEGVDVVVHLAGRAHVMHEPGQADPVSLYRRVNVAATEMLARACAAAGVHRLVFASSIKVNGDATYGQPYRATDPPHPEDDYGRSKWDAEQHLHAVAAETGLDVVIVRPPLVYGPGVKGNLARLMRLIERGVPLPLAQVDNRRSMIGVGNLADALRVCIEHPRAAGCTFLVSDGSDISTPELIRAIAAALGHPARLLAVPATMLRLAANAAGSGTLRRLIGSLQVDSGPIRSELDWRPPHTFEHGIEAMAWVHRARAEPRQGAPL